MLRRTLWGRIVFAQVAVGILLALGLPLLIDRTINAVRDDLTHRFLAGEAERAIDDGLLDDDPAPPRAGAGPIAFYLKDRSGLRRLSGPDIPDIAFVRLSGTRRARFLHGPVSDFLATPQPDGRWLVTAEDRRHPAVLTDDVTTDFLDRFAIIVPVALVGSTLACLFAVNHALRPVRQVAGEAQRIDPIDAGPMRLHADRVPAEILPLVAAANELLDRAAAEYARERIFSATVVHELRTALATISLRAELFPPGGTRDALGDAVGRAERVIAYMLELHGHDTELATGAAVPLGEATTEIVAQMQELAAASGRTLTCHILPGGRPRPVSESLVKLTLQNIIENANRHSVPGGAIELLCDEDAGTVTISDAGPGIRIRDASDGRRIYSRADGQASGSSGLGLAIVTRYMESMGGHLTFGASASGGTAATLHYPAARTPSAATAPG